MQVIYQVVFFVLAALTIVSALMVVTRRNIIHASLWLIASFFGVAGLYLMMQAEFIAVVQILVYVGAISILMLFAIMLTRQVTGEGEQHFFKRWWASLIISAALFAAVIVPTVVNHPWNVPAPPPPPTTADATTSPPAEVAGTVELGTAFMRDYLLPFEVASVILLVALIGAVVISYEERASRRRVLTLSEEVSLRKRQQHETGSEQPSGTSGQL